MDSPELQNFDLAAIQLLHKYNTLTALVKAIITANTVNAITIDSEDQDKITNHFLATNSLTEKEILDSWLAKNRLNRNELIEKLLLPHKVVKYAGENHSGKVEARFLDKKPQLDIVTYSLIRTNDAYQARELYLKIKEEGADFGSLAEKYSDGIEKSSRGVIGPVPLAKAHPRVVSELKAAQAGEVRAPINVEGINLILRLDSLTNAKLDKQMEQRLATELFDEWVNEQTDATIHSIWNRFEDVQEDQKI